MESLQIPSSYWTQTGLTDLSAFVHFIDLAELYAKKKIKVNKLQKNIIPLF